MSFATNTYRVIALVVVSVLLTACARQDRTTATSAFFDAPYWEGVIEVEGLSWRVGLEPRSETKILVDVISLWRARQPARSFELTAEGRIEIVLPERLGIVRARIGSDGTLRGDVTREDGATGTFQASTGSWIASSAEDISVERPDATIAATMLTPEGRRPFPAIVMIHGSGDSDRMTAPYRFWGDYLVQRGFAVVLYDKRGNGTSTGNWRSVGFEPRAGDVRALVESLVDHPDIDARSIGLMGVSQGVWVAGIAAKDYPRIAFMDSISGPAVSPGTSDAYAGWVTSRRTGLSHEEADERMRLFLLYLNAMRHPESDAVWDRLMTTVEAAKRKPWFKLRPFDPGPREEIRDGWYPLVYDYDPVPTLESVNASVLWIYGANDTQLDPRQSSQVLETLKSAGKDYEIRVFPEADHGIATPMSAEWQGAERMTAAPGFFEAVDSFLARFQSVGFSRYNEGGHDAR